MPELAELGAASGSSSPGRISNAARAAAHRPPPGLNGLSSAGVDFAPLRAAPAGAALAWPWPELPELHGGAAPGAGAACSEGEQRSPSLQAVSGALRAMFPGAAGPLPMPWTGARADLRGPELGQPSRNASPCAV